MRGDMRIQPRAVRSGASRRTRDERSPRWRPWGFAQVRARSVADFVWRCERGVYTAVGTGSGAAIRGEKR